MCPEEKLGIIFRQTSIAFEELTLRECLLFHVSAISKPSRKVQVRAFPAVLSKNALRDLNLWDYNLPILEIQVGSCTSDITKASIFLTLYNPLAQGVVESEKEVSIDFLSILCGISILKAIKQFSTSKKFLSLIDELNRLSGCVV